MDSPLLRSALYLPASNARAIGKSRSLDADAVILDLEDAVAPDAKPAARDAAVQAAAAGGFAPRLLAIRVNRLDTPWGAADFKAASAAAVDIIVVPKVDTAAEAAAAVSAARGKPIWAMIESPRAILNLPAIAATSGITTLVAGNADMAKELRATVDAHRSALLYALSAIVVGARANGLAALDGIHGVIEDLDGLDLTSRQGASLGFDGRTIIHPSHIESANRAYSPTAEAIDHARGLVDAFETAQAGRRGVATYRGRLVEILHAEEARRLIVIADAIEARRAASS